MEFYDGLLKELSKFDEFVDRAQNDDLSLATVYGMEKSKFILYAMSQQDNKKYSTNSKGAAGIHHCHPVLWTEMDELDVE